MYVSLRGANLVLEGGIFLVFVLIEVAGGKFSVLVSRMAPSARIYVLLASWRTIHTWWSLVIGDSLRTGAVTLLDGRFSVQLLAVFPVPSLYSVPPKTPSGSLPLMVSIR
jgi:hypothetical protein